MDEAIQKFIQLIAESESAVEIAQIAADAYIRAQYIEAVAIPVGFLFVLVGIGFLVTRILKTAAALDI